MNRRQFLQRAGCTASAATVALLLSELGCSSDDDDYVGTAADPTLPVCDGTAATSTIAAGHTHEVCVPAADLATPPVEGTTYTTTLTSGHVHDIVLSQAQLEALARGEPVGVSSTTNEGHAHAFSIRRSGR